MMRFRLHAVFLFLVLVPLAAMGFLGYRLLTFQTEREAMRYRQALEKRLDEVARTIDTFVQERNRAVLEDLWTTGGQTESLRRVRRENPAIAETFRIEPSGVFSHPSRAEHLTVEEWTFLEQAAQILRNGDGGSNPLPNPSPDNNFQTMVNAPKQMQNEQRTLYDDSTNNAGDFTQQAPIPSETNNAPVQAQPSDVSQSANQQGRQIPQRTRQMVQQEVQQAVQAQTAQSFQPNIYNPEIGESGWIIWFYGPGLQVLTWTRSESGAITGAILERSRLLADLIGRLPVSKLEKEINPSLTALVDTQGDVLYQWGGYAPPENADASASIALKPPLQSWSLRLYEPTAVLAQSADLRFYSLGALLLSLTGIVVVMAVYFIRENGRQLREASQRVSFVNQVSHELKTPLTNIRMYAELLEDRIDEDEVREKRHARIITEESHRLSRLIHNILNFSREQRGKLRVTPMPGIVDEAAQAVVERFRPALEARDITIETDFNASGWVQFDRDALEQIMCNLISNVEKYAASGGWIGITTEQQGSRTRLRVCDHGPGIPEKMREAIFEPFRRLSDSLNEGASGTGIGLSISREIACLHGGDLAVEAQNKGACFVVTLFTPHIENAEGGTS